MLLKPSRRDTHDRWGVIAVAQADIGSSVDASNSGGAFDPTAWIAHSLSIIGILVTVFLRYLDAPRVSVRVRPVLFNVGLAGGTNTYRGD